MSYEPALRYAHTWGRALLAVLCLAAALQPARADDEFPPPEEVFRHSATISGDTLTVTWQIDKGYYLYRKRMGFESATPAVALGEPTWPKGEMHEDEFFGAQEIYRGTAAFSMPLTFSGGRPAQLALNLKLQGCADAGLCYPPSVWKTTVTVPAGNSGSGLMSLLKSGKPAQARDDFLPPDEAFRFSAEMARPDAIALTWAIAEDYYLYKDRISITLESGDVQLGAPQLPAGEPKEDEFFGKTEVYHELVEATVPVARAAGAGGEIAVKVTYQGCAEAGLCYNPITRTAALQLPPTDSASTLAPSPASGAPVTEQDRLATLLRDGNLLAVLGTFFALGILLSFTPCVLPMIPILSGIIVGQGGKVTPMRGFSLAFTYVQGMALTYAAAGAGFVMAFKQAPQAFFQKPWIIVLFAMLFIALALAMFGAYNLQMPSALQSRLTNVSNQQKSGSYVGTFVMGALSALIVTACVAPAIIAALSVISQTGQIARGAGALYATGLGMGLPLLLVGASAGTLLPKVGPWMDTVKSLFGVLFMAVAIYLLTPLLPGAATMLLWAALAALSGFWIFSLKKRDGQPAVAPIRAAGLLALVYGVLLLIGAAAGSRDPLQPLDTLRGGVAGQSASSTAHALAFQRIKSIADLDSAVAAASQSGRTVMLDFYADWCVACKEMEKYTFSDPRVQQALTTSVLLQADVTANDAEDQALLKHFGIFGPPTIAFFGADGAELPNYRVVGYMAADEFHQHVRSAFAGS